MELWRDPPAIDISLHLPARNEFIPSDFSIRACKASGDTTYNPFPICILDEELLKFWYKLDKTFKLPRANAYFRITLKGAYQHLKNNLLSELFIHLLRDELNEIIYQVSYLNIK